MHILIVSATPQEIGPLTLFLEEKAKFIKPNNYNYQHHTIQLLITGPGILHTTFAMTKALLEEKFDLLINVGIGGAYHPTVIKGTVFNVTKELLGDFGAETLDGGFIDVFGLGLQEKNTFPYTEGCITLNANPIDISHLNLPLAKGLTVNKVSGHQATIQLLKNEYNPDVESMEGAAFAYVSQMMAIPAIALRAISNHVEPRNKDNWEMALAIKNLNTVIIQLVTHL